MNPKKPTQALNPASEAEDLSHASRLVKLAGQLNSSPAEINALLGRVKERWGISEKDADRIRRRPERVGAVVPPLRLGEKRTKQLYDIVELIRLHVATRRSLTRQNREFAEESAAQLGFSVQDLQYLIEAIEKEVAKQAAQPEPGKHD